MALLSAHRRVAHLKSAVFVSFPPRVLVPLPTPLKVPHTVRTCAFVHKRVFVRVRVWLSSCVCGCSCVVDCVCVRAFVRGAEILKPCHNVRR